MIVFEKTYRLSSPCVVSRFSTTNLTTIAIPGEHPPILLYLRKSPTYNIILEHIEHGIDIGSERLIPSCYEHDISFWVFSIDLGSLLDTSTELSAECIYIIPIIICLYFDISYTGTKIWLPSIISILEYCRDAKNLISLIEILSHRFFEFCNIALEVLIICIKCFLIR